ncbi:hypothetical protein V7S43_003302 [Phytophthora oleae]|uniref:Protein kinase domain-containing protein n=1 Tax=Phytophthora oleae TaxID=2107226 RepID=A0ABD3FY79_9STRA
MVSLRGLQSTLNASSALTSATESALGTSTASASSAPSSNFTSVTTKKETTTSGQVRTTVTTTTTTVTTSSGSNHTASASTSNINTNGVTDAATEGIVGSASMTTITTTEGENAASPVTTVVTDNGVNRTTTASTTDAAGITTVTTTTETDSDMNGSASSSSTRVTTSGGSSRTVENSSTTTSGTSQATGSSTSTSTTSASSSTGATMERASISTSTSTGNSTSTAMLGNSASHTTASGATTTTGSSHASGTSTSTTTGTSSGTSSTSTTTSTTTSPSSMAGSSNAATTSFSTGSTTTASSGESSTTTTTTSSTGSKTEGSAVTKSSTTTETSSTEGSSSMVTSSGSSSSSLTGWFISNFRDEETQLVVGANASTAASHQVCDGLPALVTRSSTETPNGGCPDELTALNASCTCITGYSETASSWSFHVTTESWNSTSTTTRSLTQSSSDELALTTIRPIWVSSSLDTLEIEGTGNSPAEIAFVNENRVASGSSLTVVESASKSTNISTFSIYNIDLNSVTEKSTGFVPATVTNLTLRNCNISTLSSNFTREWSWIQYLDLSWNSINTEYVGGTALKKLNLSHNALTVFPGASLNTSGLEALYIEGNGINDFNVTKDQFELVQGLTAFTADQPDSASTCQDGAWQSAHGTTFCVLGASTAAAPDTSGSSGSSDDDHHGGLGLLGYWLIAGAIIVFFLLLLLLWQRRRHDRERESSPIVSPEAVEPTTPKYNANDAFGDALNRDNAAIAAPAAASVSGVHPGYGRSHGNSVDSEDTSLGASLANNAVLAACRLDYREVTLGRCISRGGFGLVFVGSYRGRQVAVKKIRNERDVEREQVEQFVREISLISGLNHPRIVEFIGACWTTPAELSAVTKLMERGDLRDVTRRFKRRGYRLTWEAHKTVIALHIAEALTYLHGLSPTVIHRDLKAKNVLLNADMEAKLSDFGIARERSFYDGSEHMTVGIGTSFWIAPEVLLGRDYDERADIYSFGVVLSEIDTDDYPYWNSQNPPQGKAQENEILRLVARGAKRPAFSDDCPPAILELAARCLRSDPDERPSASEIVSYLQLLVQDRNSSASFSSMPRPGQSFDFSTRSTNNSSPTRTAPANAIVNLRASSGQPIQQSQAMSVPSSAYAAEKRTKRRTTTTTTTKVAVSSVGSASTSSSHPTAAETLAPTHEMVTSSPLVTHQVVRTQLPKGKRTTATTTTTTRRAEQGSASTISGYTITGTAAGSSDRDSSGRSFGTESVPSSQSHAGLSLAGPTSPASLRANHQAALDNLNQQRQLSSSNGEEENRYSSQAVGIDRLGQKWIVYEDVKEL